MTKKTVFYLLVVLLLVIAFLVILGFVSPKSVVAPSESTFQGPPPGEPGGFKGPTGPPPGAE